VITYGTTWCYAWYDGTYGYVMTKFVQLAGAVPTAQPQPTATTPAGIVPTAAPATPSGTTAFVFTEQGRLNLREEPNQASRILKRIPENGSFTVITYGTTWCYAWYGGTYGYVMTKFVRLAGETAMPTGTAAPTATPAPTPVPVLSGNQARVTTAHGDLNMRISPDQSAKRLTLIPRNAIVNVVTAGSSWCYVWYNGQVGYVMTKFLTFAGSVTPATSAPVTPAPTVPVSSDTVKYAQVTTAQGGLNMRRGADVSYARITIIPQNDYVQVVTWGNTWSYVRYNNVAGYVMTKFLRMI